MAHVNRFEFAKSKDLEVTQRIVLCVGLASALPAIVGFAMTGIGHFAQASPAVEMLGFSVNPLQNLVHLLIGLIAMAVWPVARRAELFGWASAVVFGCLFLVGLFVSGSGSGWNFLALDTQTTMLHFVGALAGFVAGRGDAHLKAGIRTKGPVAH